MSTLHGKRRHSKNCVMCTEDQKEVGKHGVRVGQVVGPGVQAEELRSDLTSNGSHWFLRSKDSMKVVFESHRPG